MKEITDTEVRIVDALSRLSDMELKAVIDGACLIADKDEKYDRLISFAKHEQQLRKEMPQGMPPSLEYVQSRLQASLTVLTDAELEELVEVFTPAAKSFGKFTEFMTVVDAERVRRGNKPPWLDDWEAPRFCKGVAPCKTCGGTGIEKDETITLNTNDRHVWEILRDNAPITLARIKDHLNVSTLFVPNAIRRLKRCGMVKQKMFGKTRSYVAIEVNNGQTNN